MALPKKSPTVASYLASLPEDRRAAVKVLHAAIRRAAPKLKVVALPDQIGYGPFHYRYATGREGDWYLVVLSSRKAYLSLHLLAYNERGYLVEQHAKELGKVKVGKSCINFRQLPDLNLDFAMGLVRQIAAARGPRVGAAAKK